MSQDKTAQKVYVAVTAATIGTVIEWYDFILYGASSALIFNKLFFPQFDPVAGTMAAFAGYAVGFLIRPIGGIVFGRLGDRIGRKPVLLITLTLMGIATIGIGLLPTYNSVGLWAPALLILLRMLQGFGAGAEYGGAVLVAAESTGGRKGFFASFPAAGVDFSLVLATGVFALFALMPDKDFLAWGWRIPFLLSSVVLVLGVWIRRKLPETPEFARTQEHGKAPVAPLTQLWRFNKRKLLIAMGVNLTPSLSYVFQIFALSYTVNQLHLPKEISLVGVLISGLLGSAATLWFGALSDKIGRKKVMIGGALFVFIFAFPFFLLVGTGIPAIVCFAVVVGHLGERAVFAVQPSFYAELFPVNVRYSGISCARELTGAFIAGPIPLVATALVAATGGPWAVAGIVMVMSGLTLVSLFAVPPTAISQQNDKDQ
jgi:MFS family permease